MLPNPGGQIAPGEVVGRDRLIRHLWRVLERQSSVLLAERRMGKTSIIRKMEAEPVGGKRPVYHDLEGLRTRLEFVETLYHDVEAHLSRYTRTTERVRAFLHEIRGAEVGRIIKFPDAEKQHWKTLLAKTLEDLSDDKSNILVFFWDEVPLMVYNIAKTEGESAAMELLDTLRWVRQTYPSFRMVFTGSIGLHNVLSALKRSGYANDPTNDMSPVEVPPLDPPDAVKLARDLLLGIGAEGSAVEPTARAIARTVDCVPYYVHHVVDRIAFSALEVSPETVDEVVNAALVDPHDSWDLRHYRERLDIYYDAPGVELSLEILDALARAEPLHYEELFGCLKGGSCGGDEEKVRGALTLLLMDHYVVQRPDGQFKFKFSLIKRFWGRSRGLTR